MSLSFKIIKSAEVRDNLLQVLPLREAFRNENGGAGDRGRESRDVLANFQAWAVAQAEETISRAQATADEILRQARMETDQIKQKAYQSALEQGLREGAERGYTQGMSEAKEEASAVREHAREVLAQAEQIRRRTLESLELEVVDLAREIAERLLSTHLALEPEAVLNVAAESLRLISDRQSITLYLSPAEKDLLDHRKDYLLGKLSPGATIHVVADASISPGGCLIETEQGLVDATLEKRRDELIKALYGRE